MDGKKIAVVGAGPGGLTSAMILAHRGFEVDVYEKDPKVGGRNQEIKLGDYIFDTGPTFLMMKFILDEMFLETRRESKKYLNFMKLDPMYRLQFKNKQLDISDDHQKTIKEIGKNFPGREKNFDKFMQQEKKRFKKLFPCLQKHYSTPQTFLRPQFIKAIPYFAMEKTLYRILNKYFKDPDLTISFTFQSKYLGMSPWRCPAAFAIIPYIEHEFGIYHVEGGLSEISQAMAEVTQEEGGRIHLNSPVKQIHTEGNKAAGVELVNGEIKKADQVIINSDFAHSMLKLLPKKHTKKYSPKKLRKKKYSCSTYMLYLGLDKLYDMPHHTILFAEDYKKNVDEIFLNKELSQDPSIYIRNASVTDKTLAPKGHSAVYVLVPTPNNKSQIDWVKEKNSFTDKILEIIEKKTSMTDLREHIVEKHIISPPDWDSDYNVYLGATFNLAHNLGQMLYFRPRNKFEVLGNCYLVGGGTHPGSGLPTIYESGRISANMICDSYGMEYEPVSTYF